MAKFRLTPEALNDIDQIWYRIYPDNPVGGDRVESAIFAAIRPVRIVRVLHGNLKPQQVVS